MYHNTLSIVNDIDLTAFNCNVNLNYKILYIIFLIKQPKKKIPILCFKKIKKYIFFNVVQGTFKNE